MEKRIKIFALILLALCLAVAPVMATDYSYSLIFGQSQTINLGNIYDTDTITVTGFAYYSGSPDFEVYSAGVIINGEIVYSGTSPSNSYNVPIRDLGNSTAATQQSMLNAMNNQPMVRYGDITFNYNVVSSTGAYLTSTVISESNTAVTYQITPMPNDGTYTFSRVYTGSVSDNPAVYMSPVYSSEDAAINYILSRGTSQTFNCEYKKGYLGLPHTMSLTLSRVISHFHMSL